MQRAILSFELPEDQNAYRLCNMGADLWGVLWEIDQAMRGRLKHGNMGKEAQGLAELVREMISEIDMNSVS